MTIYFSGSISGGRADVALYGSIVELLKAEGYRVLAGAVAADVTIPVGGYVIGANDLIYRTELTVTNHRDVVQYIRMEMIKDGARSDYAIVPIMPRETRFFENGLLGTSRTQQTNIGALRFTTLKSFDFHDEEHPFDPEGKIEVHAYIVADRGRLGQNGSTRQEMAGIPSSEYHAREAVFVGVEHGIRHYTNVGITNLHPTQTVTFFVEFQYHTPVPVVVPPMTLVQMRVSQVPQGGRSVRVYPEWSLLDDTSDRATPWVSYASTVNKVTGDAFSGTRVPAGITYEP